MSSKSNNNTLYERQQAELDAEGGRFAKPKPLMSGQVPEQPAGSPWAHDPVGPEPPLGYSVEDQAPVGEVHEVERSIAANAAEKTEKDEGDVTGLDHQGPK